MIVEETQALWDIGINVWERYTGPYRDDAKPMIEAMLRKRRSAARRRAGPLVGPPQARHARHACRGHDCLDLGDLRLPAG